MFWSLMFNVIGIALRMIRANRQRHSTEPCVYCSRSIYWRCDTRGGRWIHADRIFHRHPATSTRTVIEAGNSRGEWVLAPSTISRPMQPLTQPEHLGITAAFAAGP